ncbi:DNA-binding protein [Micromonospora rubida]|uniref:DNA-binding protein n=1 Tax=Micromonospora rubida TaxID=2697657 RepID=A0ABW7STI6_9ACTN
MDDEDSCLGTSPQKVSRREVWTVERVQSLGLVTDVVTAGAVLGIGRTKAYELARVDRFPVRVMKVGQRYVIPVAGIIAALDGAD